MPPRFRLLRVGGWRGEDGNARDRQAEEPGVHLSPPSSTRAGRPPLRARCSWRARTLIGCDTAGQPGRRVEQCAELRPGTPNGSLSWRGLPRRRLALTIGATESQAGSAVSESSSSPRPRRGFSPIWPIRRRSTAPRDDAWKAPLWQALSDAGLTLAWVPEEQGGAGAELADGFAVLGVAGRYAAAVPLAETLLAGWLLSRAGLEGAAGRDVGRAGAAGRHDHAECRRNPERPGARRVRSPGRRSTSRCSPASRSRWSRPRRAGSATGSIWRASRRIPSRSTA